MRTRAAVEFTLLLAILSIPALAQTSLPPGADETNPNPLPKYRTTEEALLPPLPVVQGRAAPTGTIYCPAEYEPCDGLFIAWEGYTDILTDMTVKITQNDPAATVWCVVDTSSEQTSATNTLTAAGAVMSRVQFIVRTTDTVWIRDYGPRFIFNDGVRAIIDHTYNRPRPNDNAFNDYLAPLWGINQYDIPLTHGGGNFHLFSNHDAFMSTLIQTENPGLTAQQIKDYYLQYQNLNLTIYTGFPTSFDSTPHIDMWMLPAGDQRVIIGQYPQSAGSPYTITENAVADFTSRGYTVFRTPGWNSGGTGGGTHYTYTNAVVLNNQVFMSKFGGSYATQDAQAYATFQAAFPGYTIHQINCASIITAAGALHCIVMQVPTLPPDPAPQVTVLDPNGGETLYAGETYAIRWQATDNVGVTSVDLTYSTDGGATYPYVIATGEANDGTYDWVVAPTATAQCRIKIAAHDGDGNSAEDVSDADFTIVQPLDLVAAFPLDSDPGWTCEGQWAFGTPTGAGSHGGDPTSARTGNYVYGYNLAGDYSSNMGRQYLTTSAIDCRHATSVELRFWRWLGVQNLDQAAVEVSADGTNWTAVWEFSGISLVPTAWMQERYDISAVADGQATVHVRWAMGPSDASITYPGWSIDDVELYGVLSPAGCAGDGNCDGVVNWRDIDYLVAGMNDNESAWAARFPAPGPSCPFANLDTSGDGAVNWRDVDPFVALMNTTCP